MASGSDKVETIKALIDSVQDVDKCKISIAVKWDTIEVIINQDSSASTPVSNTSIDEDGLESNFKESSSSEQEFMKVIDERPAHIMDKLNDIERIPEEQIHIEDIMTNMDLLMNKVDSLNPVEEVAVGMCEVETIILKGITPKELIARFDEMHSMGERLTHPEKMMGGVNELKTTEERIKCLQEKMTHELKITGDDLKSMGNRLAHIEGMTAGLDELKSMGGRLASTEEIVTGLDKQEVPKLRDSDIKTTQLSFHPEFMEKNIHLSDDCCTTSWKKSVVNIGAHEFDPEYRGPSTELSLDCHTARRWNSPYDDMEGSCVTTRWPLNDAEMFAVRVDSTVDHDSESSMTIGVVLRITSPDNLSYGISLRENSWSLHKSTTCKGFSVISEVYPLDLSSISEGTVVGLMRKGNRDLNFFKDGVDQGVAFKDVPSSVFGFVDVSGNVTQVTIVKSL